MMIESAAKCMWTMMMIMITEQILTRKLNIVVIDDFCELHPIRQLIQKEMQMFQSIEQKNGKDKNMDGLKRRSRPAEIYFSY